MIRSRLLEKKDLKTGVMAIAIRIGRRVEREMQALIVVNRRKTMADYQEAPRTTSEERTTKISHGAPEEGTVTTPQITNVDILTIAEEIDPSRLAAGVILDHLERREVNIGAVLL